MQSTHPSRPSNPLPALIIADLARISRDSLTVGIILAPLLVGLIFRIFAPSPEAIEPVLVTYLGSDLGAEVARASPVLLMSLLTALAPGLVGAVYGLLLVGERDDRTLTVVRVMPMPFAGYLAARMLAPLVLSVAATIIAYPLAGLAPLPITTVAVLATVNATNAPVTALAMAAFARDKMGALAIMRVANSVLALPILAYFAMPPVAYMAWPSPAYWQMKALWSAVEGGRVGGFLAIAILMNVVLGLVLYGCFERRGEA